MAPGGTLGRSQKTKVHTTRYERPQQVYASGQSIELREHHRGTNGLRVCQCGSELGAVIPLSALGLDVFSTSVHLPPLR
jgi:hypothetical protein